MTKPLVFIGSSTESRDIANALQESLTDDLDAFLWSQLGFELSRDVIDTLEHNMNEFDFGVFIFGPDDEVTLRGERAATVRDNVLFEFGLFMGRLGRERTFIVRPTPSSEPYHTATDLLGLTAATYDPRSAKGSPDETRRALLAAANQIRSIARRLKHRPGSSRSQLRRIEGVLGRGSTQSIAALADGAIFVADKRYEYTDNIRRFLRSGEIVPSKYLYWTPLGSSHWLNLCRQQSYRYYRNSLRLLRAHAGTIIDHITSSTGTASIDVVSVGSGDGVKDNLLLGRLSRALDPDEFAYYYPVDISDTLIVEAIRNALGRGIPRSRFRVKGLLADFVKLSQLQLFYEERPANNLFSVLGNTVGNADEDELMGAVADAMLDGDFVLMEFNIGEPDTDPVWADPIAMEHDFTPLAVLNVALEAEKLKYSTISGHSIVEETRSVLAKYEEAELDGETFRDLKLTIVHYYRKDAFISKIQERMNVEIVWSEKADDVCLVLAKRAHSR